jgi:hypothetical protein
MESLRIILLCIVAAVVYGILHDQVTARVCVEYFTVGHAPIFHTQSPTILAFGWGTIATWWVGLILGVLAAAASRLGPWPKLGAAHLIRPIACLLVVMAVAALLAGITGYQIAKASGLVLPEPLGSRIPKARHHFFFADSEAHLAAYAVGALGGLVLCGRVVVQRYRIARAWQVPGGERWIVVVSRWTARTISVPLFGLVVVLTLGDGVPNPLAASLRENLFGTVALTLLVGLVLAWKWEGAGGLSILAGLALFALADRGALLSIVVAPWLVTGMLYLTCWVGCRRLGGSP